jgi:hypothetical protein
VNVSDVTVTVRVSAFVTVIGRFTCALELKFVVSVGVKVARRVVAPTTVGVHEHDAKPADVATAVHAVIFVAPLTNATVPGVVAVAETVTGFPYFAVVTEPGSESVTVGVAFVTVSVTVAFVVAGDAAESITVIVCV